jgi:septum site-determining protein MinC
LNSNIIKIPEDYTGVSFNLFLKKTVAKLPSCFAKMGIIIDLEEIKHSEVAIDMLVDARKILEENDFVVCGVVGHLGSQKSIVNELGLAVQFSTSRSSQSKVLSSASKSLSPPASPEVKPNPVPEDQSKSSPLVAKKVVLNHVATGIVRGGQELYKKGKNLVLYSDVKVNGKVVSDGDIFVFGKLEGQAFAGGEHNMDAQIVADCFMATIISIGGAFRMFDDEHEYYGKRVRLYLEDEKLKIDLLSQPVS